MVLEQRHRHARREGAKTEGTLGELGFADDADFESARPTPTLAQRLELPRFEGQVKAFAGE